MAQNPNKRKVVECGRKRIPLRKILNGKEIRGAAKALEDFRLELNEKEFLFGAKIYVKMEPYGEAVAVAYRPETDNEMQTRLDAARERELKRIEREKVKAIKEQELAVRREKQRQQQALNTIVDLAKANGLTVKELSELLEKQ